MGTAFLSRRAQRAVAQIRVENDLVHRRLRPAFRPRIVQAASDLRQIGTVDTGGAQVEAEVGVLEDAIQEQVCQTRGERTAVGPGRYGSNRADPEQHASD